MLDHQPSAEKTAVIHEWFLPSDSRSVQDNVTVVYLLSSPCSSKRSALRGMKPGPKPWIASCRCSTLFPNGPQFFLTGKKEDLMHNRASGQAAFLAAKLRNQTLRNDWRSTLTHLTTLGVQRKQQVRAPVLAWHYADDTNNSYHKPSAAAYSAPAPHTKKTQQ
jgi:hypothetical protein